MNEHVGDPSIGQLKISITPNVEPKDRIWKPFNQEEEFERKAKESVLYDIETPILDKYLKGGRHGRDHYPQLHMPAEGRGSQLTSATMNSVATDLTNDSSLPCMVNIL